MQRIRGKVMKQTIIIIALFIAYSLALGLSCLEIGKSKARLEVISNTVTEYEQYQDSTRYKPQIIIKVKEKKVNEDSIYAVAKKYWQDRVKPDTVYGQLNYVAHLDTTYEDDNLKADINFNSRIPLDPEGYYKLKFDVKKTMVFVPTYKAYEPDTWGIGFGVVGHFQDSVNVNLFGNISYKIFNMKHFEMPITAEIELGDNLNIVQKSLRVEGRFKF
jgi:hypothetical protein